MIKELAGQPYLIFLDDDFFLQYFDGIQGAGGLLTTQNNFTKGALAQGLQELEIFKSLKRRKILIYFKNLV